MALNRYELDNAYDFLSDLCKKVNDNNIENYDDQLSQIDRNLEILKKYLNSSYPITFRNRAIEIYNKSEILYNKLCSAASHSEDKLLREANDDGCKVLIQINTLIQR